MESVFNSKKRRRKFLECPRFSRELPKAWAYKEFKIGDLFDIHPTKSYGYTNSKLFEKSGNVPVVVNSSLNNGIGGYVDREALEKGNMITFSDTTTSDAIFYQPDDFIGYSHVQGLYAKKEKWSKNTLLYLLVLFKQSTKGRFDYATKFNRNLAKNIEISLPITPNGDIDFDFMEKYIRELEVERIRELEAYLEASGLNDTILSEEENAAINKITNGLIKYKEFKIGDLFEKINTIPLKYKVNDLPKEVNSEYNLPALTAGVINQGLSCFVKRNENYTTILKNVISVSANGANSGAMFYQDCEFTVLQDAYAIRCIKKELDKNESLYFLSALQKVIKGNFNWVNKAGWHKIKNYNISLPITEKCDIDFDFMEKYIRAIEKKAIKGVVDWKDKVIAKTKEVVAFSDKDNGCIGL